MDSRITRHFPLGSTAVDVGCGSGKHTNHLAELYQRVIGLDINATAIKEGTHPPDRWSFIHADFRYNIPLKSDLADVVFANQVIEHIVDPHIFVAEVFRIIRPGGTAVFTTPNIRYIKFLWRIIVAGRGPKTAGVKCSDSGWDHGHVCYFTARDMSELLESAGFVNIKHEALIMKKNSGLGLRSIVDSFSSFSLVYEFLAGNLMVIAEKKG